MTVSRRLWLGATLAATGGAGLGAGVWLAQAPHDDSGPAYAAWHRRDKGALDDRAYLAMCAGLAPSAHNTQPWRMRLTDGGLALYAAPARHLGSADAERRMMQLSLGCALENLVQAARRLGHAPQLRLLPALTDGTATALPEDAPCVQVALQPAAALVHPWFDAIFEHRTCRAAFDVDAAVPPGFMAGLEGATADLPGVGLHWFAPGRARALQALQSQAVREFLSPQRHRDGMAWFRITRREWETRRDGIAIFTSAAPFYAQRYVEWFATERELLGEPFRQGEIDAVERTAATAALWGLVHAEGGTPAQRLQAGRLAQRVALEAAASGVCMQPLCYATEMPTPRRRLAALAGLAPRAEPLYLFRVGRSSAQVAHSVRRGLDDLLHA